MQGSSSSSIIQQVRHYSILSLTLHTQCISLYKSPPLFNRASTATAVYSPLSTSDTPRATTSNTTTTAYTTVEAENSSAQCSLCKHIIHTEPGEGNKQMPLIVRLQCGHIYHKVCILQRVIAPTFKKDEKCYDCIHSISDLK